MKISCISKVLLLIAILVVGDALARKHRTYKIKKGDTPAAVSKKFRIPADEILRYNNLKPGGSFRAGQKLTIPFRGEVTGSEYVVKQGDSVARIADFHGISQGDLREANGLSKSATVRVGQKLVIPHELRGGAIKGHVIQKGDTLASIAKKHHVSVKALAAANKLKKSSKLSLGRTLVIPDTEDDVAPVYRPRKVNKLVKSGKKVKGGVRHTVQTGQSLWIIARAYNTSGARIAKANGFSVKTPLSVGKEILVPGAKEVVPVRVKGFVIQPIRFVSVWNNEKATLKLLTKSGKINKRSRRILSKLAGPKKKTKRVKLLHPRLIHMLQRVAERFPGHTIEIVSGYRPHKRGTKISKHSQGRAVDFRVKGISKKELYNYIKELPKAGAGYYPNSVFVHLDVRGKKALWTDHSGVGESANYRGPRKKVDVEAEADALSANE
ncbi:MAG: LysM peptidoglycan-binding domain-containing protein [Deltaproteobacteria bacterium]|nr:LysM peptidoglycan-binding domain-containing protein [Deltaproteobacteria bacterium]